MGLRLVGEDRIGVPVAAEHLLGQDGVHPDVVRALREDAVVREDQVLGEERGVEPVHQGVAQGPALRIGGLGKPVGVHGVGVPCRTVVEVQPLACGHGLDPVDLHPGAVLAHPLRIAQEDLVLGDLLRIGVQPERPEVEPGLVLGAHLPQHALQPRLRDVAERAGEVGPVADYHRAASLSDATVQVRASMEIDLPSDPGPTMRRIASDAIIPATTDTTAPIFGAPSAEASTG